MSVLDPIHMEMLPFLIAHGVGPAQVPAVHSIGAAKAVLKVERLAGFRSNAASSDSFLRDRRDERIASSPSS